MDRQLYKIGAVARLTGISAHTLRNWEERHGAVHPRRSQGGKRLYSEADVQRLSLIKKLADQGLSLDSIASCSHDELAERWGRISGQQTYAAPAEPVRVAVLGSGLATWVTSQEDSLVGTEIVAAGDDAGELQRELCESHIDLLLVECPAITGKTPREVRDAMQLLDAPAAVVVYWFGSRQHIETLQSWRVQVLRAPADLPALQQAVARSGATRGAGLPSPKSRAAELSAPQPPRLSREALARMAASNPNATCGCQKNLVDVVLSLRALEDYLGGCDSRSPEDDALHRALSGKVGEARSSIEDAIEHFASVEGIEL